VLLAVLLAEFKALLLLVLLAVLLVLLLIVWLALLLVAVLVAVALPVAAELFVPNHGAFPCVRFGPGTNTPGFVPSCCVEVPPPNPIDWRGTEEPPPPAAF
jgi:hypothetical protein